jgi:hypothetical protein
VFLVSTSQKLILPSSKVHHVIIFPFHLTKIGCVNTNTHTHSCNLQCPIITQLYYIIPNLVAELNTLENATTVVEEIEPRALSLHFEAAKSVMNSQQMNNVASSSVVVVVVVHVHS